MCRWTIYWKQFRRMQTDENSIFIEGSLTQGHKTTKKSWEIIFFFSSFFFRHFFPSFFFSSFFVPKIKVRLNRAKKRERSFQSRFKFTLKWSRTYSIFFSSFFGFQFNSKLFKLYWFELIRLAACFKYFSKAMNVHTWKWKKNGIRIKVTNFFYL